MSNAQWQCRRQNHPTAGRSATLSRPPHITRHTTDRARKNALAASQKSERPRETNDQPVEVGSYARPGRLKTPSISLVTHQLGSTLSLLRQQGSQTTTPSYGWRRIRARLLLALAAGILWRWLYRYGCADVCICGCVAVWLCGCVDGWMGGWTWLLVWADARLGGVGRVERDDGVAGW